MNRGWLRLVLSRDFSYLKIEKVKKISICSECGVIAAVCDDNIIFRWFFDENKWNNLHLPFAHVCNFVGFSSGISDRNGSNCWLIFFTLLVRKTSFWSLFILIIVCFVPSLLTCDLDSDILIVIFGVLLVYFHLICFS